MLLWINDPYDPWSCVCVRVREGGLGRLERGGREWAIRIGSGRHSESQSDAGQVTHGESITKNILFVLGFRGQAWNSVPCAVLEWNWGKNKPSGTAVQDRAELGTELELESSAHQSLVLLIAEFQSWRNLSASLLQFISLPPPKKKNPHYKIPDKWSSSLSQKTSNEEKLNVFGGSLFCFGTALLVRKFCLT